LQDNLVLITMLELLETFVSFGNVVEFSSKNLWY